MKTYVWSNNGMIPASARSKALSVVKEYVPVDVFYERTAELENIIREIDSVYSLRPSDRLKIAGLLDKG